MKKLLPFVALFGLWQVQSEACSFYPSSFCDVVQAGKEAGNASLLEFTILERFDRGVRVQIETVWYGFEPRTELTIWDRDTIFCTGGFLQETSQWGERGTRIVAMLQKIDSLETDWEVLGDYRGSVFAFTDGFLRLKNGRWKSDHPGLDIAVDIGKGRLKRFLSECIGENLTPQAPASITIAPNPASGYVNILRSWSDITEIRLFDLSGREVALGSLAGEEIAFSLTGIANGTYILVATVGETIFREKLVIYDQY